jgi:hypothetical protein
MNAGPETTLPLAKLLYLKMMTKKMLSLLYHMRTTVPWRFYDVNLVISSEKFDSANENEIRVLRLFS